MKFTQSAVVTAVGIVCAMGSAHAATVVPKFEGVNATYPSGFAQVADFYNGGTSSDGTSGTNYGVQFTDNALAICLNTPGTGCSNTSRGGLAPDRRGVRCSGSRAGDVRTTRPASIPGSSTLRGAQHPGSVSVHDGLNGTGTLLRHLESGPDAEHMR